MPVPDNECQHKPDQEEIEEIEHVADCRGERDFPLVRGQLLLLIEKLEHDENLPKLARLAAPGGSVCCYSIEAF